MKIQTALNNGFLELKKNNIKTPLLDCEMLMSKAIQQKREFIILNLDKKINQESYITFKELINERLKGKPVAYLIGKKYFWKHEFYVNQNVLVPRPESEIIVENVLKIFKNRKYLNLLEIGVGSGCLILSLLQEKKKFFGSGIDLTNECLKICKINANRLGVTNRLKLYKSDIDNFHLGKYDLIISNPPYINRNELKYLEKEIKYFEPNFALNGGLDGISEIRKVINRSSELIKKKGKLILEIGFDQKEKVKELLKNKGFFINKVLKDYAKNDRCVISTKI